MSARPTVSAAAAKTLSEPSTSRDQGRRAVALLVLGLGAASVAAWWFALTFGGSSSMMAGMLATGVPSAWLLFLGVWGAMMVAMMFPAVAPMVLAFVHLGARPNERRPWLAGRTVVFVGTYAGLWTAVGLLVALAYATLTPRIPDLTMSGNLGPGLAGSILVLAGVYESSPLKDSCLTACRSPFTFLATSYRPGFRGAVRLGARHAAYCLGCCALLFAVLFAVGLMSLGWMALVAVVIFAEKLLVGPPRRVVTGTVTVLLVALGVSLLLFPSAVAPALGLA